MTVKENAEVRSGYIDDGINEGGRGREIKEENEEEREREKKEKKRRKIYSSERRDIIARGR